MVPDVSTVVEQASLISPPAHIQPSVTYSSLVFSDGTVVNLDASDIVVFVGPNNAGKSAALRELEALFTTRPQPQTVIKTAEICRQGDSEQVQALLERLGRQFGKPSKTQYLGYGYSYPVGKVGSYWDNNIEALRSLFLARIATESRITASNPATAIPLYEQAPAHPIQLLFVDDGVELRISSYFHRAFAKDLIVFRGGGGQWPLVVGDRPKLADGEDRVSATYLERLRDSAISLESQGDGMRSFATVILYLLASNTRSILLLDEPEAFLHPPQARLLGEFIAKERSPNSQLFVATHSADVLQGLLSIAPEHLRILRIQRQGNVNRVKELDKAQARAIGADPIMKFSSVLSGVFFQRVIICESDADCMFYSVLLDLPAVCGGRQPDVLFVHAGGKHRVATLAGALRALDVDVDVIVDMDVLNELTIFRRIVEALGGAWDSVHSLAAQVKDAIEHNKSWLNAAEVAKGVGDILNKAPPTGEFPRNLKGEIDSIFRKASPWDGVKSAGEAIIPSGQATQTYKSLRELCQKSGLWIVPVGELEGFCKSVGGHGPRWVQEVIETHNLANSIELESARRFVRELWARI